MIKEHASSTRDTVRLYLKPWWFPIVIISSLSIIIYTYSSLPYFLHSIGIGAVALQDLCEQFAVCPHSYQFLPLIKFPDWNFFPLFVSCHCLHFPTIFLPLPLFTFLLLPTPLTHPNPPAPPLHSLTPHDPHLSAHTHFFLALTAIPSPLLPSHPPPTSRETEAFINDVHHYIRFEDKASLREGKCYVYFINY